ncbi:MAG: hypothetical protein KatS3mg013_1843 [Actinomycetota bacterium]|nr:MAG: hypothetical protein KatS3mg013_1843 [Actinomycetota bacterium]
MTNPVIDYLLGRGAPFLVLPSPHARSPEEAAAGADVGTDELVRTLVLRFEHGHALGVVPWPRAFDLELAREALDDPDAAPASPEEIAALAPGCSPDAIPPLGMWLRLPMLVDVAVARLAQVAFPAGRPSVLVCMQRTDLFRGDPYGVAILTRASLREAEAVGLRPAPRPDRPARTAEDLLPIHLVERPGASGEPGAA